MKNNETNAFLFVTHKVNSEVMRRFLKLQYETKSLGNAFFLINQENNKVLELDAYDDITPYVFNVNSLNGLNYEPIRETIIPGSNHFATLQFYLDYPIFKYYWVIEYDVVFTGHWDIFFPSFNNFDADFIASHIERYTDNPNWIWWETLHLNGVVLQDYQYIKSFNPIYRISTGALSYLDSLLKYRKNWGHHEVLIPTALNYSKFKIMDIGGCGDFSITNSCKISAFVRNNLNESTMRYRPSIRQEELILENKLLHPCKVDML